MLRYLSFFIVFSGYLISMPFTASATDINPKTYRYPIVNPFEATVAKTPPALRPKLPSERDIDQKDYELSIYPTRQRTLSKILQPLAKLKYRVAKQKGKAPLIFIIAGTGAKYSSSTPEFLKRLFWKAGYHVVQISSPTSYDFMTSASKNSTPGLSSNDANDLYRVMQAIKKQQSNLEVSNYFLTGYSLGALNAAFVSQIDSQKKVFNFKRVLMINPPVNLYTSISNLDRLVHAKIEGVNGHDISFYDFIIAKLTRFFKQQGYISFNEATAQNLQQSDEHLTSEQLAMLIGTDFRFSSADIAFTSDLINHRGLITPLSRKFKKDSNLTPYLKKALACDFQCYIDQQLFPEWKKYHPESTFEQLVQQVGLYPLENYLKNASNIAVMHNADDIILGSGDLGFLRKTFGDRLTLYPLGGHCGNINYKENTDAMLDFFHE